MCEGPLTPVTVRCVSCSVPSSSYQLVRHTLSVVLLGHCEQCDGQTEVMVFHVSLVAKSQLKCAAKK